MLKSLRIVHACEPSSHEDLFMERYSRLLDWSLRITDGDVQLAEDLVHDAFIQFSLSRPALHDIRDLDAYLYVVLRNINVSRVRRVNHLQKLTLTAADYDSAEIALRSVNPRAQLNVRAELRSVCHYACVRRETSKAGSLLILRYFHGYYPEEIARVARTTRTSVYQWLKIARQEARRYLEEPNALKFMSERQAANKSNELAGQFPGYLGAMIQSYCVGGCPKREQIFALYESKAAAAIDAIHGGGEHGCRGMAQRFAFAF